MKIELNLVRSQEIYGNIFSLVVRDRVEVENSEGVSRAIAKFISSNLEILDAALTDKGLVTRLGSLEFITTPDFMCLKYLLASSGLDILVWGVSDVEVNQTEIPFNTFEYNLVDDMFKVVDWVSLTNKVTYSIDSVNITELYTTLTNGLGLFENDLFVDFGNPIKSDLEQMKRYEGVSGTVPNSIIGHFSNVLRYLGKNLVVLHE